MKKIIFLLSCLFIYFAIYADEKTEIDDLVSSIQSPTAPVVKNDYLLLTANKQYRYVGVAFDFEDYKIVHPYKRLVTRDTEDKVIDSVLFYIAKIPKKIKTVQYRVVIDGIWTCDPLNSHKIYNQETNLEFSKIVMQRDYVPVTEKVDSGVRFVYDGEPNKTIRLAGSFTNWDSFIYELEEIYSGHYELEIPLTPGRYYYSFYTGTSSMIDTNNPDRAYTQDGRVASVLIVK